MENCIYRTQLLDKQLRELAKADKRAGAAADRAEQIIQTIARSGQLSLEVKNKLTRHGELRLANCCKYDLGSGYRLISLKQGGKCHFVFAGSHDDCDRWLENQRGSAASLDAGEPVTIDAGAEILTDEICFPPQAAEFDDFEEQLSAQLDDKTLRQVFRGICARRS